MNKLLDLRDICGEDNLASYLGLGTNSVGGLWKKLAKRPEAQRKHELSTIAQYVAQIADKTSGAKDIWIAEAARMYGVSPRAVLPLVDYHHASMAQQTYSTDHPSGHWGSWGLD